MSELTTEQAAEDLQCEEDATKSCKEVYADWFLKFACASLGGVAANPNMSEASAEEKMLVAFGLAGAAADEYEGRFSDVV